MQAFFVSFLDILLGGIAGFVKLACHAKLFKQLFGGLITFDPLFLFPD